MILLCTPSTLLPLVPRGRYATIALGMVILFCLLEFVEAFYEGINKYCADMWNVSRPAPKSSDLTPSPSLVRPRTPSGCLIW